MRKILSFTLLVVITLIFAESYAAYHLSTVGYKTSVLVSNMSEEKAYFRVLAFNCYGKKLWQDTYSAQAYSTVSIDLAEFIPSADENWGLLLIECDQLLHISVLYQDESFGLLNVDHVIEPVQSSEDAKYYWYAAGYLVKDNSSIGLVMMNPNKDEVSISIWICNSNGETVDEFSGSIEPFAAVFLDLLDHVKDDVGVVDIQVDLPIIIGVEHYEEGEIWTIDNIVDWYTITEW